MLDLDHAATALASWATKKYPVVRCLVLFGSYVKGSATPGSDLDVAIAWTRDPSPELELEERLAEEIENLAAWRSELESLLSFDRVSLHSLDGTAATDRVRRYIRDAHRIVFDPDSILDAHLA